MAINSGVVENLQGSFFRHLVLEIPHQRKSSQDFTLGAYSLDFMLTSVQDSFSRASYFQEEGSKKNIKSL